MSINRQQRRREQRDADAAAGSDDDLVAASVATPAFAGGASATERLARVSQPAAPSRRETPRQFLHEVNVEMRKVVWPTRAETVNYASVVLVTLAVLMALIFGLDLGFSKVSLFLFK